MGTRLSLDGRGESPQPLLSPHVLKHRGSLRKRWELDGLLYDELRKIPGRLMSNGGGSNCTTLFTQQGGKGINQDAMIVWQNFGSRVDTVFCGIFDGHGSYGHMVAGKVRDHLPLRLLSVWGLYNSKDGVKGRNSIDGNNDLERHLSSGLDGASADSQEIDKRPEIFLALKESFSKAFHAMDKELKCQTTFDCLSSGTTAVTLVKQGQDLVIANLGDSRAILGTRDDNNSLVPIQLTVDLRPNLPREKERIKQCKGWIFALQDEPEVDRIWLPHDDSPGLAMARALGDFCLKDFGLISVPEVSYRHLTEKDEFIVLATDGVWDVLSNEEVVDIIAASPSRSSAARHLVQAAVRAWKCNCPNSKVDDCTAVCLYLNGLSNSMASCANGERAIKSSDTTKSSAFALRRSFTVR